ncbi:MAG: hypothetical protein RIR48_2728 [Bacteroidota bacterium]|jgi:hypothetical protein
MTEIEIKKEKVYLKLTDKYAGQSNVNQYDAEIIHEENFEKFKSRGFEDFKDFVQSSRKTIRIIEITDIPVTVKIFPTVEITEL